MAEPKERDPLDRFYTEDRLALRIAETVYRMAPQARTFLEPSSGGGAFLRAIRGAWGFHTLITAVDIDPGARAPAEHVEVGASFFNVPFFDFQPAELDNGSTVDVVLMNPPFATPPPPGRKQGIPCAAAHVRHALGMLDVGGVLACLIRQSFLATQDRAEMFKLYCPAAVDILVERPSFTQDGATDQHEYCVVYWQRESRLLFRRPESTILRWLSWK